MQEHEKFVDAGGIILRILVGNSKEVPEDYQKAKERMERAGIEVKYIQQQADEEQASDFLWVFEEGYGILWYRGVGDLLDRCTITDRVSSEIRDRWRVLQRRAEEEDGGKFKKIPHELDI